MIWLWQAAAWHMSAASSDRMKWTKSGGTFRTSHRFVIRLNHLLNNPDDNDQLEKATKKRRGGRASLGSNDDLPAWLERTVAIFDSIDQSTTRTSGHYVPVPPSGRKLRDRGKLNNTQNEKSISEPEKRKTPPKSAGSGSRKPRSSTDLSSEPVSLVSIQSEDSSSLTKVSVTETSKLNQRQVPRVILKLGKKPDGVGA